MNWRLLTRSGLVFVATFAVLLALTLAVLPGGGRGERRGIRIDTVGEEEAEEAKRSAPVVPDAPIVHEIEGPRFYAYETVELPGPDGALRSYRYLAFHLACARAEIEGPGRIRAEDLAFLIFGAPATAEEARRRTREPAEPSSVIRAGHAIAAGVFPTEGEGGGGGPLLTLGGGVRILSTDGGRRVELVADELICRPDARTVVSKGAVEVTADAYRIRGVGLSGDAALGTFSIERDVTAEIPTAALLGADAAPVDIVTTIRGGGPLLVERLGPSKEETGRTPTRVTLDGGLRVEQPGGPDEPMTTLRADRAELSLAVLTGREPGEGEAVVEVSRLVARGSVSLDRGEETHLDAAALTLLRLPNGERIRLEGPANFRHLVLLPVSDASRTKVTNELRVSAAEWMDIQVVAGLYTEAEFRGAVVAEQRDAEGALRLELRADDLRLLSDAAEGDLLVARGDASFAMSGVDGRAEEIRYRAAGPALTVVGLSGRPAVRLERATGFDLFAPATPPAEESASPPGEEGPRPVLHLEAEEEIALRAEGERREFRMKGPSLVRRTLEGRELVRVEASSIEADLVGEDVESLRAEGPVHAVATGEAPGAEPIEAFGSRFVYSGETGAAALTGTGDEPALVRLSETADREQRSEIRAATLTLVSGGERVVAEGSVRANVFLPEEGGKVRPVRLEADRLEVVPRPERPAAADAAADPAPDDPAARIERLTATGNVVLDAGEWHARGHELVFRAGPPRKFELSGAPARLTRDQRIHGESYEDRFEATSFSLSLRDGEIASFTSPTGGDFLLHRAWRPDMPAVLGASDAEPEEGAIERFTAGAGGEMVFDAVRDFARLEGRAVVKQEAGPPGKLARVAEFAADVLDVTFDRRKGDNVLLLREAKGRGSVTGEGDGWRLTAEEFSVDAIDHRTVVTGTPAVVVLNGRPLEVYRAEYDYDRKEWTELVRARPR